MNWRNYIYLNIDTATSDKQSPLQNYHTTSQYIVNQGYCQLC